MSQFDQYRLFKIGSTLTQSLQYGLQNKFNHKQIFVVFLKNILKRFENKLFKGKLQYYTELQNLLDYYLSVDNSQNQYYCTKIIELTGVYISQNTDNVQVRCQNCGNYTNIQPFNCNICSNAFYCDQQCWSTSKNVHYQRKCKPNIFPPFDTSLQVEIHMGGELGQNIEIYYQHQSRMSLMLRGRLFLQNIYQGLLSSKMVEEAYQVIKHKQFLVLNKTKNDKQSKQLVKIQKFEDLCNIYLQNSQLYNIKILLLQQGCILMNTVKEIYATYLKIILIFRCAV